MNRCLCGCEKCTRPKIYNSSWGPVHISKCLECGQARDVVDHNYDGFYSDTTGIYKPPSDEEFDLQVLRMKSYVDFIRSHIPKAGEVLEIGCNAGYLLSALEAEGWAATGLELNPSVANFAVQRGLNVTNQTLNRTLFSRERFDLIIISHVLEHIPDISSLLQECFRLLKPFGHLLVVVPNYGSRLMRVIYGGRWYGFIPGQHIWYFTQDSLKHTCEMLGFKTVRFHKVANIGPESRYFFGSFIKGMLISWMRLMDEGDELYGMFRRPN